jgi:hypothetical protein
MQAEEAAKADETVPVPIHLRNAPTKLMKEMNYGADYLYNPAYRYARLTTPLVIFEIPSIILIFITDTLSIKNTFHL